MTGHPVVVFDGMCVLCSANAQFILKHDRRGYFRLAAMQSDAGAALMRSAGVDPNDPDTFVLIDGKNVLKNSDAVIAIWKGLGWPWRVARMLKLVPRPLRDFVYSKIARNRYRWFGKRETCWVPTPEQATRIL